MVDTTSPLHKVFLDRFSDILHWTELQKLHDAWQSKLVSLAISDRFGNVHDLIRDLNSQDNKIAVCNLCLEKRSSQPWLFWKHLCICVNTLKKLFLLEPCTKNVLFYNFIKCSGDLKNPESQTLISRTYKARTFNPQTI